MTLDYGQFHLRNLPASRMDSELGFDISSRDFGLLRVDDSVHVDKIQASALKVNPHLSSRWSV